MATASDIQWIATAEILREYVDVLRRPKFGLSKPILQQWSDLIELRTLVVPTPPVGASLSRDPKDAIFLAAALAANADYLITGDKDLLHVKSLVPTQIVTVADFAAKFGIS